jgi:hypothetical protein
MIARRRRCAICGKLTSFWQRTNGGPWHCDDGCYSTTGRDRRTENGEPLWKVALRTPAFATSGDDT